MDYLLYIGIGAFWSIPYVFVLRFIFGILQIPFAFISRKAVYFCYSFYCFFIAQFFAGLAVTAWNAGLSIVPLLLVFSVNAFLLSYTTVRKPKDESEISFWFAASCCTTGAYLIMALVPIVPLSGVYETVRSIINWFFDLPVLGPLLENFSGVLYIMAILYVAVQFVTFIKAMIATFRGNLRLKE